MDEIEVPTEHLHEHMHESAEHARERWIGGAALSSALLAVLAALAALLAGHHANEAMIEQIRASDKWAYYQAKGIKSAVLSSKLELLEQSHLAVKTADRAKLDDYKKEQDEITQEAQELEHSSQHHLHQHEVLARSVTVSQVAIAIAAISVLTRRRPFWLMSLVLGLGGLALLIQGLVFT